MIQGVACSTEGWSSRSRSALHSLSPLCVGTDLVESLSSYVTRLAASHNVPRHQLEKYVCAHESTLCLLGSTQPVSVDAATELGKEFARRLSNLTQQPEVARLGLGWMSAVWAPAQALRSTFSWCPACVAEMSTPHFPMAWQMKSLTMCPLHKVNMQEECGACGHRQKTRQAWLGSMGQCPNCGESLARGSSDLKPATFIDRGSLEVSQLTSIVVGIGQRSNWNELRPPDVPELLRCAVQDGTVCTAAQLADAAGMTKGGLHRLISKEAAAPSFETLMRLCAVARVSPLAVLGLEPMVVTPEQSSVSALKLERRKENQHHDWAYVKAALRNAMDEQPVVPTAAEFARRHGVCQAQLRREMPGMVSTLSALSRKNRLARLEQAADSLAKGIVEKARMASICGKRASTAEVAEMLGVGRNDIAFRRAMKQVKSAAPAVC
jgi:transcriptional regulator with XRE-family HTH domain